MSLFRRGHSVHLLGILGAILVLLLATPSISLVFFPQPDRATTGPYEVAPPIQRFGQPMVTAYTEHAPITITSDADFSSQGWPGSGTKTDPYVIADLNITSDETLISISDTAAHFVVTGCLLVEQGSVSALYVRNATNGRIEQCVVVGGYAGIYVSESSNNTLADNVVSEATSRCIYLYQSSNNTVIENNVSESSTGIYLRQSYNNTVLNNTVSGMSWDGISLSQCTDNALIENKVLDCSRKGISLSSSGNNTLSANVLTRDGIGIDGSGLSYYIHSIYPSNTVNGMPVGYLLNLDGVVIDGSQYGQVILVNSTATTIRDGVFANASVGLEIAYSTDSWVVNNTITGNQWYGMWVVYSSHNTLSNNTVSGNPSYGIQITHSSSYNRVENNTISGNEYFGLDVSGGSGNNVTRNTIRQNSDGGIRLASWYSVVERNTVTLNSYQGILLDQADHSNLTDNMVSFNEASGIRASSSDYVAVLRNTVWSNGLDGIYMHDCHHASLTNNTVTSNSGSGLSVYFSDQMSVVNNTLSNNSRSGMSVHESTQRGTIVNNTFSNNGWTGVYLENSHDNTLGGNKFVHDGVFIYSHALSSMVNNIFPNNTVNGKPLGQFIELNKGTINGNDYGQVILLNCTDTVVENGFFDETSAGVEIIYSHNTTLRNNEFVRDGIFVTGETPYYWAQNISTDNTVDGKKLGYFYQLDNSAIDGRQYGQLILVNCTSVTVSDGVFVNRPVGMQFAYCDNITVTNTTVSGSGYDGVWLVSPTNNTMVDSTVTSNGRDGVLFYYGTDNGLTNCNVSANGRHGIYVYASDYNGLENCTLLSNGENGVYVYVSWYYDIENCTIQSSEDGIYLLNGYNGTVTGSTISHNSENGMYLQSFWDSEVTNNTVFSNAQHGINLYTAHRSRVINNTVTMNENGLWMTDIHDLVVTNNTVTDNSGLGVRVSSGSSNNLFYLNRFGWNLGGNGQDSGSGTDWNNTATGNYWSDYNGTGVYYVGGSPIHIDYLPMRLFDQAPPTIDHPADTGYDEGTTGHSITWAPSDMHPSRYEVYLDTQLVASGDWDGGAVSVVIDGLSAGVHNYTLVVYDIDGNTAEDTVLVTVTDVTPPYIDSPPDIQYSEDTTGHSITWSPSDPHPSMFWVFRNETLVWMGPWQGGPVTVGVDGLPLGIYNYTLVVSDEAGHNSSDIVFVTVIDTTAPIIDHPSDIAYEEGTTGHTIVWSWNDQHHASYEVYRNGTLIDSGAWTTPNIAVSVDGLDAGIYNYTAVVYDTSGNRAADTVIVTVTDTVSPSIDSPSDVEYSEDTTGHSIVWSPSDAHPASYEVYRNGTIVESGAWTGDNITVNIDGLGVGAYNYTLVVYDESGNHASDTVIVTVVDTTVPSINHPSDITYAEGTSGHSIEWTPYDRHPAGYEIYRNGNLVISGVWTGDTVAINVDGLSAGTHNYTIVVYDESGNWVGDTVIVTVTAQGTTTETITTGTTPTGTATIILTTLPLGFLVIVLIVVAASGAVIAIVIVIVRTRRRP